MLGKLFGYVFCIEWELYVSIEKIYCPLISLSLSLSLSLSTRVSEVRPNCGVYGMDRDVKY